MSVRTLQKLSIPEESNVVFVSPELSQWASLLAENRRTAESIGGRCESRNEILGIARTYTQEVLGINCSESTPAGDDLVATGHQAVWHHCGIWAKNLAAHAFAKELKGRALHLVLDHDIRDTAMVLPDLKEAGGWRFRRVEIEPSQRRTPLEFRRAPTPVRIRAFVEDAIRSSAGRLCGNAWPESELQDEARLSRFGSIADWITHSQAILNVELGMNGILYVPISRLSHSDSFLRFVVAILPNADGFAGTYNAGIDRASEEPRGDAGRPPRRLEANVGEDLTELPFWLVTPAGRRLRFYANSPRTDGIRVGTAGAELAHLDSDSLGGKTDQLKNALRVAGLSLRPRAVSLTLFARLFLADWFVHGVGGAGYEGITDHIIRSHYRLKPMRFAAATCTMRLPIDHDAGLIETDIATLKHRLHHIRHNPQNFLDESTRKTGQVTSLLGARKNLVARATDRSESNAARRSAWESLKIVNQKLCEYSRSVTDELEQQIAEKGKNALSRQVCDYREYFFGLFPPEQLKKTARTLRRALRNRDNERLSVSAKQPNRL